jgi:uncharacterized protein YodC (DUF2158 family)
MSNFKEGDVVKLNSGSPFLTIVGFNQSDRKVQVRWYDNNSGDFKYATIEPSALSVEE